MIQDIEGIKFEAKIPPSKFDDSCFDYLQPFDPSIILSQGNCLRIRSAKFSTSMNVISLNGSLCPGRSQMDPLQDSVYHLDFASTWSSKCKLMVIPEYFKLSQLLNERVIEDCVIQTLLAHKHVDQILKHQKVITQISKFYDHFEVETLKNIYFNNQFANQNKFRVKFIFMEIESPSNPEEFCRLFCKKCQKSISFKNISTQGNSEHFHLCPNCGELCTPVY